MIHILSQLGRKKYSGYVDTNEIGNPTHLFSGMQHCQSLYYSGKTYMLPMKLSGGIYDNENMIFSFDHSTKAVSSIFDIGKTSEDVNDTHANGTVFITSTGRILVARTEHNTQIYLAYTDNQDLSAFQELATIGTIEDYVQILEKNGRIYLWSRHSLSSEQGYHAKAWYSDDDGGTWTEIGRFLSFNSKQYVYPHANPYTEGSDWMYVSIDRRNRDGAFNGTVSFPQTYLLKTQDFITFYNINETYSRNFQTEGIITQALAENYTVEDAGDVVSYCVWKTSGIVINDIPYFVTNKFDLSAFNLTYWNGSSWVQNEILTDNPIVQLQGPTGIYYHSAGNISVWVVETVNGFDQIARYRTTDYGVTWQRIGTETSNLSIDHYIRAGVTYNANQHNKGLVYGMTGDGNGVYSDAFIKEI